jgi:hypothetical protein
MIRCEFLVLAFCASVVAGGIAMSRLSGQGAPDPSESSAALAEFSRQGHVRPAGGQHHDSDSVGGELTGAAELMANVSVNQVVHLTTDSQSIIGRVLAWDEYQLALLTDRGALRYVPWKQQVQLTKEAGPLQPRTAAQLHVELQQEFGQDFTVRASAQFVVVQPTNCQRDWARLMQQFYGNVQTYCSARQIPMQHPQFPLVAVVMPSRQAMVQYAEQQQDRIGSNFLAYYSLSSNRVLMFDSNDRANDGHGPLELETVFHEAFHQIAFNTRLHKRTAAPPLWVSEGMAAAFETPGMSDHRRSKSVSDRVHPFHLRRLLEDANGSDFERVLTNLIDEDSLFQTDSTQAYAVAWAMAFYWMEHSPHRFARYLETINQRTAFSENDPELRRTQFRSLAQCSVKEFATRIRSYYERLSR